MVKLSSYKLVQFLKKYINPKEIKTPVLICSRTAQTWLYKLGFVYEKMCKNVFVNGYKQPDRIKDQNCFLTKIEKLKPYIIGFNKDNIIKSKDYPVYYTVGGEKRRPIIVITHDEYTFFTNDGV